MPHYIFPPCVLIQVSWRKRKRKNIEGKMHMCVCVTGPGPYIYIFWPRIACLQTWYDMIMCVGSTEGSFYKVCEDGGRRVKWNGNESWGKLATKVTVGRSSTIIIRKRNNNVFFSGGKSYVICSLNNVGRTDIRHFVRRAHTKIYAT